MESLLFCDSSFLLFKFNFDIFSFNFFDFSDFNEKCFLNCLVNFFVFLLSLLIELEFIFLLLFFKVFECFIKSSFFFDFLFSSQK